MSSALHERLSTYAKTHGISLTDTVVKLLEKGLEADAVQVATKQDIELLTKQQEIANLTIIQAIREQPIAVQQQLPEVSEMPHKGLRGLFKRKVSK
jgi:hypothetical protein